jgi:uncharacterized protein Yka (UPF0111/DUF47 family)
MSAFDDAWNALSAAIGNTFTARNQLDPGVHHDQWHVLDDQLTQLENRRDILTEAAINKALSSLSDPGDLANLKTIIDNLNNAAQEIKNTATTLAAVTEAVSVATSLIAFALKLVP